METSAPTLTLPRTRGREASVCALAGRGFPFAETMH